MFEQTFKNIDDILHKDAGCTSELDYTEQSSWLLFLKYLDALEVDKASEAELEGKQYNFILDEQHRWEAWAAPKTADGKLDHNAALTGDDLRDFVNGKLFPYLGGFKQRATGPNTIEYKIGEVFGEIKNKIQSGYNLRDVIELVDELRFQSQAEKHELSYLYEAKIKNMGNAGRNGGEYYTPRPLIRAMVKVVDPQIGERIYDGACGSAGFLCEAFDYLSPKATKADDLRTLQTRTFYGKEKKSLAYVIAIMNMILHGIEAPNVIHANTLAENISDIQERDRYDVILANPPFGGKERKEVQQNFPIKTGETAFLFLQHFIKSLKAGGRAAIIVKNTFLSNADNASTSIRKLLLDSCNLHTILDMPSGTFQGAGVKTVILFFEKGAPTRKIWFYRLNPGRNMGKTNSLNDSDLVDFIECQKAFADSAQSWSVDVADINATSFDLSVKNPRVSDDAAPQLPDELLVEVARIDSEYAAALEAMRVVSLPSLTGSVPMCPLEGLTAKNSPITYGVVKPGGNGDVRFVRGGDISQGKVLTEQLRTIDATVSQQYKRTLLKGGELLISLVGQPGQVAVAPPSLEGANIARQVGLIRLSDEVDAEYVRYFLQSPVGQASLGAKQSGSVQQVINLGELRQVTVPLPDPKQQGEVVAALDEIETFIELLSNLTSERQRAIGKLKAAYLRQAFLTAPEQATS